MLSIELNTTLIPQLKLRDTVKRALQLINDFKVSHLPVVADNKYLGLISEDDLLDADSDSMIEIIQEDFIKTAIDESEHFLAAVNISIQYQCSIVPVINKAGDFLGTITSPALLKALGTFAGAHDIVGIIVLEMERNQFAISEISRIVESNEATILHLNTIFHSDTGLLSVTLHLNKKELSAIVAAFERYEYIVTYYFGEEKFENEIENNYRHLMNYLDI